MDLIPTVLKHYQRQDGSYAAVYDAPLVPRANHDASFAGHAYEMGDLATLRLTLKVYSAAGTSPTLDVVVETSEDGVNDWQVLYTFGQKTAAETDRQAFAGADRFVRARALVGGTTPNFDFALYGEAV
jgi:hypothetical protein